MAVVGDLGFASRELYKVSYKAKTEVIAAGTK